MSEYPEFHASWLSQFTKCPESARAVMYDNLPRKETDSTALGTSLHAAIDFDLDCQLHDEPTHDLPYDVIENMLDALEPWTYTRYSKLEVRRLAAQAFDNWREHIEPHVRVEATEVPFKLPLTLPSGREVVLGGRMDAVDARGFVIDWKSGSRAYELWEAQRWNAQATVYCYADSILRPRVSTGEMKFWFMLHDNTVKELDVTRDARHFAWMGVQLDRICDLIDADLSHWPLIDSSWACSPTWCANWDNCKGAVMGPGNAFKS